MGIIVQFPKGTARSSGGRYVDANSEPASVIILPVVRIERNPDEPSDGCRAAATAPRRPQAATRIAFVSGSSARARIDDAPVAMAIAAVALFGAAVGLRHQRRFRPGAAVAGQRRHPRLDGPGAQRAARARSAWRHQLTDEERRLRDLAYPLIEPPYDRNKWYSVLGELGLRQPAVALSGPHATTPRSLFTTAYRSQTARYNRLIEDIRNDVLRLDPFFADGALRHRHGPQARARAWPMSPG